MRFLSIFFSALIFSCSVNSESNTDEWIEIKDEDDSECRYEAVSPVLPELPEKALVAKQKKNLLNLKDCKDLPEVKKEQLILKEGCYKGCVTALGRLEISGAGTEKTLVYCDDIKKNAVLEVQQNSNVTVNNISLGGVVRGVFVNKQSSLELEKVVISDCVKGGINVCGGESDCGSVIVIENSLIENIKAEESSGISYGISMGPGKLVLNNSVLSKFSSFGIAIWGENDSGEVFVEINNSIITDVSGGTRGYEGHGIYVEGKSEVSIAKTVIENIATAFLYFSAMDQSAKLSMEDLTVENILDSEKEQGGLVFEGRIKVDLNRISIINSRGNGIYSKGAEVSGENIKIAGVSGNGFGENGFGLMLIDDSRSYFNKVLITDSEKAGVFLDGNCFAEIQNLQISRIKSDSQLHEYGVGIAVQENAELKILNAIISEARECGVMAVNGKIELHNVEIKNTLPRECIEKEGCVFAPNVPFGHGISLYNNSIMTFEKINILNNNNGINVENSEIRKKSDGDANFFKNISAVNAWNLENPQTLEMALINSVFCDNGSVFTTDVQPVRDGI